MLPIHNSFTDKYTCKFSPDIAYWMSSVSQSYKNEKIILDRWLIVLYLKHLSKRYEDTCLHSRTNKANQQSQKNMSGCLGSGEKLTAKGY